MPPQLVAEQGPSSSGNLSTFITIHSVKRTMSSPPRLLPYLHLVPDLGKLSPTGDWHMCCLVGWRGSSEMFLTELGVRPCPAADRSSQGLQKWLTVYDDLNGQITATHFHSNHSLWNSDMRTPRITALSLKKKKNEWECFEYSLQRTKRWQHSGPIWLKGSHRASGQWVLLGWGSHFLLVSTQSFLVGSFILSANHQTELNLSEIPLRLLLLKLFKIYLVCCKEPHFHVGTDGAKLSLTETDNSKTEI